MKKLESKFEQEFNQWVKEHGGLSIKMPANVYTGIPDRMVLHEGRTAFIELKRDGEKPRKIQQFWLDTLRRHGFVAFWLTDKEFNEKYKEYGIETIWLSRDACTKVY